MEGHLSFNTVEASSSSLAGSYTTQGQPLEQQQCGVSPPTIEDFEAVSHQRGGLVWADKYSLLLSTDPYDCPVIEAVIFGCTLASRQEVSERQRQLGCKLGGEMVRWDRVQHAMGIYGDPDDLGTVPESGWMLVRRIYMPDGSLVWQRFMLSDAFVQTHLMGLQALLDRKPDP